MEHLMLKMGVECRSDRNHMKNEATYLNESYISVLSQTTFLAANQSIWLFYFLATSLIHHPLRLLHPNPLHSNQVNCHRNSAEDSNCLVIFWSSRKIVRPSLNVNTNHFYDCLLPHQLYPNWCHKNQKEHFKFQTFCYSLASNRLQLLSWLYFLH